MPPSITVPTALAVAGAVSGLAGAGVSAAGAMEQGQAAKAAANYNAQVAQQNQQIATQDAVRAGQAGEAQVAQQQMKTRAQVGGIIANEAAAGLDVNSGSALDVRSSAAQLGQLSALSVRTNAAQQAYGYTTEGTSFQDQANLDIAQAKNASTAGAVSAGGTILGGVSNTADNWARYVNQNSLNPSAPTAAQLGGYGGP